MARGAYYNENDPFAAAWLRNLIAAGHIAPGDVDERSIADVRAEDLAGYVQCHFFAGIGIWSAALRQAGWPDDRPVWTGSCPCQPLSAAGKGLGTGDSRHLWPVWLELIRERRPVAIFGEQVASADGLAWLDLVSADLEDAAYSVGAVDLCASGFGAPHIRQRLWFVAYAERWAAERRGHDLAAPPIGFEGETRERQRLRPDPGSGRDLGDMADASIPRRPAQSERTAREDGRKASEPRRLCDAGVGQADADTRGWPELGRAELLDRERAPQRDDIDGRGEAGELGLPAGPGREGIEDGREPLYPQCSPAERAGGDAGPGPVNGFWRDADWIACTDGKARPVEAGTFPLVDGDKGRVGKLRAYGNAINQEVAAEFIGACIDVCASRLT